MVFPIDFLFGIHSPPVYISKQGLVYCGDCIKIMRQIPTNSIDLIVTDPPYGIAYRPSGKSPLRNDHRSRATALFRSFLKEGSRILKPGRCCLAFCFSGGRRPVFPDWIREMEEHFEYKSTVIWDKCILGRGTHYRHMYDMILVGKKSGGRCFWNGGGRVSNVIHCTKVVPNSSDYPTPKPVELLQYLIGLHSDRGDIVLDPFAGHGSTLVAAMLLKRRFVGVEIERKYCKAIKGRL